METAKTIAIIGATEKMGAHLAIGLGKTGNYRLLLMSADETGLASLRATIEEEQSGGQEVLTMSCARDASWEADVIVVASLAPEREIAERIREVAVGKIVIQLSGLTVGLDNAAIALQKILTDSRVVGVCPAGMESDFSSTTEALIAGNNGEAVETVAGMLKSAGLRPVATGDLGVSRARGFREFPDTWRIDLGQVLSYLRSMTRALR